MLLNPSKCGLLTRYQINNASGQWLHSMLWAEENEIGALPEEWNFLEGWSDPKINPKLVHMTRGTPDMEGYENIDYAQEWNEIRKTICRD